MFVLFRFKLISMFLRSCTYELEICHANQTTKCLRNQCRTKGEVWSTANWLKPPVISLLAVPRPHFCFVSSCFFFFSFFLARFIPVLSVVSICLVCFVCVLFVLFLLFVVVFLENQSRTKVNRK